MRKKLDTQHELNVWKRLADWHKTRGDMLAFVELWDLAQREYSKSDVYYRLIIHYQKGG